MQYRFLSTFAPVKTAKSFTKIVIVGGVHIAAFTLLEMCIILVIIGFLSSVVLGKMTQDTRRAKAVNTQIRFDKIQRALQNFSKQNYRLPRPADGTLQRDVSTSFGIEVTSTATANFYDSTIDHDTIGGTLPVRALAAYGLTDNDAVDEWGNMFGYFVSYKATLPGAFALNRDIALGTIQVKDGSGGYRTSSAIAMMLSYGPSGHGAYQISGLRKNANMTNTDTLKNCHCDSTGAATTFDDIFVFHPQTVNGSNPLANFDMTGRYFTNDFFSPPASPGPITYALNTNDLLVPNQYLQSVDGRFKLLLQSTDGDLVLYQSGVILWSTGGGANVKELRMQTDGNLVKYNTSMSSMWNSGTSGNPGSQLTLQNDGNLIIYNASGVSVWNSGTGGH